MKTNKVEDTVKKKKKKKRFPVLTDVYAIAANLRQSALIALLVLCLLSPPPLTLLLSLMYICAESLCPCCSSLCLSESL